MTKFGWVVLRIVTLFLIALVLLRLYAHAAEPTPRPTPELRANVYETCESARLTAYLNSPLCYLHEWSYDQCVREALAACPKPTPVIPLRERMRRAGINYAHNVQPGEKLPTPRTNVPPPVPLQFAPGVKPTTDMRPKR